MSLNLAVWGESWGEKECLARQRRGPDATTISLAVSEGPQGSADLLAARAELVDSFDKNRAPNPLQIVERRNAVDRQTFGVAESRSRSGSHGPCARRWELVFDCFQLRPIAPLRPVLGCENAVLTEVIDAYLPDDDERLARWCRRNSGRRPSRAQRARDRRLTERHRQRIPKNATSSTEAQSNENSFCAAADRDLREISLGSCS
jgi:hypothetical protein